MKLSSKAVSVCIIVSLLVFSTVADAKPIYSPIETPDHPALQIMKWVDKESPIQTGENVTVYVNITNFGKSPAYNITINEPFFSDFSVDLVTGFEPAKWVVIGTNASISYSYSFTFEKPGNYLIEATTAFYTDSDQNSYKARSGIIDLEVIKGAPPISLEDEWRQIFLMLGSILALPIVWLLLKKFVIE